MVDDWSLRDEERIFPMDFISYSLIKKKTFLLPEDLELLRQKLIEDISGLHDDDKFMCNLMIDIINKRFGVD